MPDEVLFYCPHCNADFKTNLSNTGRKVQCWKCEEKFILAQQHLEDSSTAEPVAITAAEEADDEFEEEELQEDASVTKKTRSKATQSSGTARISAKKKKKRSTVFIPLMLILLVAGGAGAAYFSLKEKGEIDNITEVALSETKTTPTKEGFSSAKLKQDDFVKSIGDKKFSDLKKQLRTQLAELEVDTLLTQNKKLLQLRRHELIRVCGSGFLEGLSKKEQGKEFLQRLLSDPEWMDRLMASGPMYNPRQCVDYLYIIWKYDKQCEQPFYQKLATAIALKMGRFQKNQNYHVFKRFQSMKQAHRDMKQHASFDHLKTWEMRFTIDKQLEDEHYQFMLNDRRQQHGKVWGNCWSCAYKLSNSHGDSIHGRHYYAPWDHAYGWGEKIRKVGGVCGSLSHFGTRAAQVQGIPAMTAGEPGHCAHVIRGPNGRWTKTYTVTWPTTPHEAFWGHSYTYLALMEDTFKDQVKVRKAYHAAWFARLLSEQVQLKVQHCKVYHGSWGSLPDFTKMKPMRELDCNAFDLAKHAGRHDNFGLVYTGEIEVLRAGEFEINLQADDFASISIDKKNLGSGRWDRPIKAKTHLAKGSHTFRIAMNERGGAEKLQLKITPAKPAQKSLIAYDRALKICPTQLGLWKEYKSAFIKTHSGSTDKLKSFSRRIAHDMQQHQEAAWHLLQDAELYRGMDDQQKISHLLATHRLLDQSKVKNYENYPMDRLLNTQAGLLSTDEMRFQFFSKLLSIHKRSNIYFMWVFNWGSDRFNKGALAAKYNLLVSSLCSSGGLQGDVVGNILKKSILAAAANQDNDNFQRYAKAAEKVYGLDKKKPERWPAFKAFPGVNLGAKGSLRIDGGTSRWDNPVNHRGVLANEKAGGFFHTDKKENPWVEVKLQGKSLLSGITIVGHWANKRREVPLIIETSIDGKTWIQVFRDEKERSHWMVDLRSRKLQANFVRIKAERTDVYHLRGIFVYGKKLF